MSGASIDYAIHGHATMVFTAPCGNTFRAGTKKGEENALKVKITSGFFFRRYRGQTFRNVPVHFEINHYYFSQQQKAIAQIQRNTVTKLLPLPHVLKVTRPRAQYERSKLTLDEDYQQKALDQILNTRPEVPHLVLGPFGTGKTHLVVAAVLNLLQNSANRVLVCTHLNKGADSIYSKLQETEKRNTNTSVLRLVPGTHTKVNILPGGKIMGPKEVNIHILQPFRAIITTFLTALNLGSKQLNFTHILIDEGAQSREAEALGAFVVARSSTKVVIVGDNKQVRKIHSQNNYKQHTYHVYPTFRWALECWYSAKLPERMASALH